MSLTTAVSLTPQQLAETVVDKYLDAIGGDLPWDKAPGDFSLLDQALAIQDLIAESASHSHQGKIGAEECHDCSMRAGFILGYALGRRVGGAR